MIQGPRTWISPAVVPSHGSSRPASSTIRSCTPATTRPDLARQSSSSSAAHPFGGSATAASGLVSVMPHAWMMRTPCCRSKRSIRLRGTAEPPQTMSRSEERSIGFVSAKRPTSFQMVGTAPATVARSSAIRRQSGSGWRNRPGISRSAPVSHPAYGSPQALAWNIGTMRSTRSYCVRPKTDAMQTLREWRTVERWL